MSYRVKLEKRLQKIENRLIKMASIVEQLIDMSMHALETNNNQEAVKVIEMDKTVDQLEMEIEKNCVNVISLEQPMATDLREITAVMKIITDLERVGDYAVNIAKIQISLDKTIGEEVKYLKTMHTQVKDMLHGVISAFINDDVEAARDIAKSDEIVDNQYEEIYMVFLDKLKSNQSSTEVLVPLLFSGRYLERMGDHIVNICERLIYMVEGVHEYY